MYVLSIWCVDWNFNMFTFDIYFRLFLSGNLNDYFSFLILIFTKILFSNQFLRYEKMDIDKYIKIFMYIFKHRNPLIFEKYKKKNMISLFIIHYIQRATNAFFFFFFTHNFNIRKSDYSNYHFNSLLTEIYNAL